MVQILAFALAIFTLAGCQSTSRKPASHSPQVEAEAISAYHEQMRVNLLEEQRVAAEKKYHRMRSRDDRDLVKAEKALEAAEDTLKQWQESLSRQATRSTSPVLSKLEYNSPWRFQRETFDVANINDYIFSSAVPSRKYFMSIQGTRLYELQLFQTMTIEKAALDAEMTCDQTFELNLDGKKRSFGAGSAASFKWEGHDNDFSLRLRNQTSNCSFRFKEQNSSRWSGVQLRPEAEQFGDLVRLTRQFQVCSLPNSKNLTGVEKFFFTPTYSSMTCPETAEVELSGQPIEGLTERIRILTGSDLPQSVIDARNPFVDLDFSKAPKLDLIVVTSLVFRSDFYGQLLARAMLWHAQRGTIVRVLNSKVLELKKDREMLKMMTAASDNVKIQTYAFDSVDSRIKSKINELHRVSHVKLFATYSRTNPFASVVIIGGRNVHEGYILPVAIERLGLPQLIDYKNGEDSYLYYRDVEAIIRSRDFAETAISHFLTFWQRQPDAFIRSASLNLDSGAQADPNYFRTDRPLIRHILSLPYKDDRELNDVYADLIDSAEREIKITTPYFLPTKKVGKALERAVKRGVDITIITKTEITGDNPQFDHLTSAANQISANKYWEKLKVYDYTVPNSLLHSKLILVDQKLTVIGSVNLNRRSFYHDVENAAVVFSPAFTSQLLVEYDEFLRMSKQVEAKRRVPFLKRLIVGIINKEL